ncbi:MAG: thiosulfate oxidation carrier complex protein SoxZ [Burkholderiaceae bacterium]
MGKPMRIRAKATNGVTTVRALMAHVMEGGQRKDSSGKVIPAHHITDITASHNGKVVLSAQWGSAVSQNPFLAFSFKGGASGDKVTLAWKDNKGDSRTDEVTIA